jgi:hypothetical protein
MPSVKAYEYRDRIVVKYFDDGRRESLTCPHCHWFGSIEDKPELRLDGFTEVYCPDCNAKLAMVACTGVIPPH